MEITSAREEEKLSEEFDLNSKSNLIYISVFFIPKNEFKSLDVYFSFNLFSWNHRFVFLILE
jgi:hypothetical protein